MTLEAEPVSPGEALSGKLSGKLLLRINVQLCCCVTDGDVQDQGFLPRFTLTASSDNNNRFFLSHLSNFSLAQRHFKRFIDSVWI